MQIAGNEIKTEQPPPSNPQLLPSEKQDKRTSALEQKPPQHKPKQETVKLPNLESCQRWFRCHLCNLRFPSRTSRNKHYLNHVHFKSFCIRKKRTVQPKKQYMCYFCPRVFPIKELRELHMKVHVKSKIDSRIDQENVVYFCDHCEKYFSNVFELRTHKKRTMNCSLKDMPVPRKVHSCQVCSKEFEDSFDLTSHSRTHGAPLKSYSIRKPKPNSLLLNDSISARNPKPAESVNATKAQENRESCSDSNLKPPGSVNATNVHKDRNLGDSFPAQNPKPTPKRTQDETAYDTGIHSDINKLNRTVVKAEKLEVVFGEKVSEYSNNVWPNAIVKEEPQELDDMKRMVKAVEYDNESMIKTEPLSLCKYEFEDESVLGLLLHESQGIAFEVQSHTDTAADNEQNIETVIVKEEAVEFTENISEKNKDLVNAALEAAWKELYAEHEAMELALVKIEKDPEITGTMDLTTDIVNKQDTIRVKEEVEV